MVINFAHNFENIHLAMAKTSKNYRFKPTTHQKRQFDVLHGNMNTRYYPSVYKNHSRIIKSLGILSCYIRAAHCSQGFACVCHQGVRGLMHWTCGPLTIANQVLLVLKILTNLKYVHFCIGFDAFGTKLHNRILQNTTP